MPKKVFIASLSHSGSTLLDLLLGCHPQAVSLGEIHPVYQRPKEASRACTCGMQTEECPVWGPLKRSWAPRSGELAYIDAYREMSEVVSRVYSDETIVIDSSKYVGILRHLIENGETDIAIVYLVKDVRSFILSQHRRKHVERLMKKDGWRRIYTTTYTYSLLKWYVQNRRLKRYLDSTGLPYFQLGYEELCLGPEKMLRRLCEYLQIDFDSRMLAPANSRAHILHGNKMRRDPEQLSGIQYDAQWMRDKKMALFSPMLLPVMQWNNDNVYGNLG